MAACRCWYHAGRNRRMKEAMIYCLDTSGINALHDDPEREVLIIGLLETSAIRVTGLNVTEVYGTESTVRRASLLGLLRRLGRGYAPFALPTELLQSRMRAFIDRSDDLIDASVRNSEACWVALNEPLKIDEALRQGVFQWKRDLEQAFKDSHKR